MLDAIFKQHNVGFVNYRVQLVETEEGWAASCLDLKGCHSQGATRQDALDNILEAIRGWLEVEAEENGIKSIETIELALWAMPRIPGIHQKDAVRVFQKLGYRVVRQSGHIIMSNGNTRLTIPRHNPIHAITMGNLARDAGLTPEAFRNLL